MKSSLKTYLLPLLLLSSIIAGGLAGIMMGANVEYLKPIRDIFLNLILVAIVPLVFFSVASSVEQMKHGKKLAKLFLSMLITFLITGVIAALYTIVVVMLFPPAHGLLVHIPGAEQVEHFNLFAHVVNIFTVDEFTKLFSHQHLLPLIFFAILVGVAVPHKKNEEHVFAILLRQGSEVFIKLISIIMYFAPIGFFAFFAVLIHDLGSQLLTNYLRVIVIYYVSAVIYFMVVYSFYAYLAAGKIGFKKFWKHIYLPVFTALATCSSAISIPASMQSVKKMGVPRMVYESVIPLGTFVHKEGSILGGILKISFLFGLFHLSFSGFSVVCTAILVSLLVGSVMGAIPGGGMLGELLIVSCYGFPKEALMMIVAISILIDPLATIINVVGNNLNSLLVARLMRKKIIPIPSTESIKLTADY